MKNETRRFWHSTDDGDEYLVEAVITQDYPQEGANPAQYSADITRIETHCGRDVHPADLPADVLEDMVYWALQADGALGRFFVDEYHAAVRYWSECADAEDRACIQFETACKQHDAAMFKVKDAKRQLDRIKNIRREPATN
jgi:hypothetical protein